MTLSPRIDRIDRNLIINGNFQFWQRGTTFSGATYGADRWFGNSGIAASGYTRQAGGPSTKSSFFCRITGTSGFIALQQRIESVMLKNLSVGQELTLGVYAKTTTGTPTLNVLVHIGGGVDNYSSQVPVYVQALGTLSTSWQLFTYTFVVTSDMQINGISITLGNETAVSSTTYDIAEVCLAAGSFAQDWTWCGGGYQEELALCQRYYEEVPAHITNSLSSANATTSCLLIYKVTKRIIPTVNRINTSGGATYGSYVASSTAGITATINASNPVNFATFTLTADAEL